MNAFRFIFFLFSLSEVLSFTLELVRFKSLRCNTRHFSSKTTSEEVAAAAGFKPTTRLFAPDEGSNANLKHAPVRVNLSRPTFVVLGIEYIITDCVVSLFCRYSFSEKVLFLEIIKT